MTDSLYNPRRTPHVSHFKGTELMTAHILKNIGAERLLATR